MTKYIVNPKMRPLVVKKNLAIKVPSSIKVVSRPIVAQIQPIEKIKQKQQIKITQAAVKPNRLRKQAKRRGTVQQQTRNISPESLAKIKNIRNIGLGKVLIIIGNGPSVNQIPLDQLKNHPNVEFMSVNTPDKRIWPTKFWSFFDRSQINKHKEIWNNYSGIILNSTSIKEQKQGSIQFKNFPGTGWSRDLEKGLHIGRSSVFASMQIAAWMQYKYVFVVGCDMSDINGQLHFYGENLDVKPEMRKTRFAKEAESYYYAANILTEEERSHFIFCSKGINTWPFMNVFETIEPKNVIDKVKSRSA